MEQSALGAFTCPVCRRTIDKTEYWDVGYIRMKWLGDERYDGEEGVFVYDGDIHPCVEGKHVCQDCFEAVMSAIRRCRNPRNGNGPDDAWRWVWDARRCLLSIDMDEDALPKDVREWICDEHMRLTRLEVRLKELSNEEEQE